MAHATSSALLLRERPVAAAGRGQARSSDHATAAAGARDGANPREIEKSAPRSGRWTCPAMAPRRECGACSRLASTADTSRRLVEESCVSAGLHGSLAQLRARNLRGRPGRWPRESQSPLVFEVGPSHAGGVASRLLRQMPWRRPFVRLRWSLAPEPGRATGSMTRGGGWSLAHCDRRSGEYCGPGLLLRAGKGGR